MLTKIYKTMLKAYGTQNWWPVAGSEVRGRKSEVLTENQKLEICIGAFLTQNTNWKNVEKSIAELNKNKLIDVKKLAVVDTNTFAQLIRSSGYFNQKADRIKLFAKYLLDNYNGSLNRLFDKDLLDLRAELLSLKGIGPETADSIILYAAQKPVFVVDAYTKRIFSRIGLMQKDLDYECIQEHFHKNLKHNTKVFNEYHALIVEHAKRYCQKKPICESCILNGLCEKKI